jgi:hypothetical protein
VNPRRWSAFLLGVILGAAIWLLSPWITGRSEPWDAENGYYSGALLATGVLGGLLLPMHWAILGLGILVGQALVILGGVLAEPASGGLWPLGLVFLAAYSILGLVGALVGAVLRRSRGQTFRVR